MHDFKPGDLVRTAWTREKCVVVENARGNGCWTRIGVAVYWFGRGATTQVRASVMRRLEEE